MIRKALGRSALLIGALVILLLSVACSSQPAAPAAEEAAPEEAEEPAAEAVETTDEEADPAPADSTDAANELSASALGETLSVGVSTNALANEHNRKLFDSTQAILEELGHEAIMVNANGDAVQQLEDIENLIQSGVDALIVQNGDKEALGSGILQASEQGIPVISVESGDAEGVSVHITPNEFIIGATIASYLAGQVGNEGPVATIYHSDNHAIRTRGYEIETVLREYQGLQEVAHHRSVFPGTTEDAYAWMESTLLAQPEMVAVFASQDLEAIGVARAIQAAGRDDILTIGVDGEQDALRIIEEGGPLIATIIQDVEQEAELSVDAAVRLAIGEELGSRVIFIPFDFVTKENVDEYLD